MNSHAPIGVFDSGVGGLSLCHAIRQHLPDESLTYFADLGFSPYGEKSKTLLDQRCELIVDFLIQQGCKAVVIGCNTATVHCIARLRANFAIPIIGVEPGVKPAALRSQSGVIGVLATHQTLQSQSFADLKGRIPCQVQIEAQACPAFVELVENLKHHSTEATQIARNYLQPLLAKGCDQIVLGCTHFPFLRPIIEQVCGNQAQIIDTAMPVAVEVGRQLQGSGMSNPCHRSAEYHFWASDVSPTTGSKISQLWGLPVTVEQVSLCVANGLV